MIDPDIADAGTAPDTGDRTVRQFAALCGLLLIVAAGRVGYAHGATPRALGLAFAAGAIALLGGTAAAPFIYTIF